MHFFPATIILRSALLKPILLIALLISIKGTGQTVLQNEISPLDRKKIIALSQYWINMLAKEGGCKVVENYGTSNNENFHSFWASYDYRTSYGEKSMNFVRLSFSTILNKNTNKFEIRFTPTIVFKDSNANLNYFLSSALYNNLKAKKNDIKIEKVKYWKVIHVENFQFEEEEEYKNIYAGKNTDPFVFNVKAAFDLEDEIKSPKFIAPNINIIAASREKANLYHQKAFYSRYELQNEIFDIWSKARFNYQQAWAMGDDTSALLLGFLYLNPVYKMVVSENADDETKNKYELWHGKNRDYKFYNPTKALAYFDSACRMGNTTGYYGIGQMHEYGLGMEKNITKAISFYEKGSARANLYCLKALYQIYINDLVNKDSEKAKECKEKIDYLDDKKSLHKWPWTFVLPALINTD